MKRVSSAEMAKKFSLYSDLALNEPIIVTRNGRDRLVILSVDEYNFLRETVDASRDSAATREDASTQTPHPPHKKKSGPTPDASG